jgi:hypothetical protein
MGVIRGLLEMFSKGVENFPEACNMTKMGYGQGESLWTTDLRIGR